jgi:hypothetical protein
MRRGAAWPAERPSSRLVVREHKHGWASQRVVARRGGQGGPDAGCAVVTVSAFVSGIRCPVSGASVRCPTRACPGDRCPVRASKRPGVQCPAPGPRPPAPGVRAFRRPLCPTGMRSRGVAVGQAAARLAWPGSAWSPAMSMPARRLPEVGAWRSKLAQAVLDRRRVDWDLVVVLGGGWQWPRSTGWPTGRGWMRARIARRGSWR